MEKVYDAKSIVRPVNHQDEHGEVESKLDHPVFLLPFYLSKYLSDI